MSPGKGRNRRGRWAFLLGLAAVIAYRAAPGRRSLALAWDIWRAGRGRPADVTARQQARLVALVAHARAHSRYYARRYRAVAPGAGLRDLPPITKAELMAAFDDWVTDPGITRARAADFVHDPSRIGDLFLGRYVVFTTSGTSGTPAILIQDPGAMSVYNTIGYVRGLIFGQIGLRDGWRILRGGARSVVVFAGGGHFVSATLFERQCRDRPWRRRFRRSLSVQAPLPEIVRDLNAFRPVLLASYASMLDLLAAEQEARRLRIRPVIIGSAGETLPTTARSRIERAFGCGVRDVYATAETLAITRAGRRGALPVNADWFIVEPVDQAYQPVPSGQLSHTVLVTNLANQVQPIIRYDLGDRVILDPRPCPAAAHCRSCAWRDVRTTFCRSSAPPARPLPVVPLRRWRWRPSSKETPGVRRFRSFRPAPPN
ncbi:MAG: phenylacetate--CoA ligase family protein [Dehalococcoidia bacterium]